MKKIVFISIFLSVFMISCNKGESLAKKHFNLIESCFKNHTLEDFENGKVSKLVLYDCIKPHQEEFNKTRNLAADDLDSYRNEFKRLMNNSKYEVYLKAIYKMKY